MRLLPFRIGEGDLGPRLAKPKAQLPEQALALTHAQRDAVLLSDPDRQRFAIPQIAAQPGLPRRLAKSRADLFQLLLIQAPGPPRLALPRANLPGPSARNGEPNTPPTAARRPTAWPPRGRSFLGLPAAHRGGGGRSGNPGSVGSHLAVRG